MKNHLPFSLIKELNTGGKLPKLFLVGIFIFLLTFLQQATAQNCTVNAGVDAHICPNQPMQLHGTSAGLYTDGGNIHWSQKSGPSVNIVDPYNMNTYVTGYIPGGIYGQSVKMVRL